MLIDTKQLISLGIDAALNLLEQQLIENLGDKVPLLGDLSSDALDFIRDIKDGVNNRLPNLSESTTEAIRAELFDLLHNDLGILLDGDDEGTDVTLNDIELTLNNDGYFLGAKLGGEFDFATEFAADLGLPNLGFNIEAEEISIGGEYGFDLGFGIDVTDNVPEFYIDTQSEEELFLNLNANLNNLKARGDLGFLQLDIEDINPGNEVEIGISVDLIDSPDNLNQIDNKLTVDELSLSSFETDFNAGVDVKLGLVTSFDGSEVLPSLNTDFKLIWEFDGESENGNIPSISFEDVQIDLGTFFSNFADPIFKNIQEITKPIEPIAKFLTRGIQFSDTSFSEFVLSSLFGTDVDLEFIEQVLNFVNLVNSIPTDSDIVLDLGSFDLGENDPRQEAFTLSSVIANITKSAPSLEEQTRNTEAGEYIQQIQEESDNRLQFPIIENPSTAFGLLLGKDVDLFTYQLPELYVSIKESYPLVVVPFGGVFFASASIGGSFEATSDVEFGFDTFGLTQLLETGDVDDIFNGFFIRDNGNQPLVMVGFGIEATAEIGVGIEGVANVSGGLTGGIEGNLGLDLIDPNNDEKDNDEKVRKDELISTFSSSSLELFNIIGRINFIVDGFIAGELFGASTVFYEQNLITEELLSFTVDFRGEDQKDNQSPFLATNLGFENFEEDGILRLNIGADADFRSDGKGDISEVYVIKHEAFTATNETVLVSSFGVVQDYKSINKIIGDAGQGDDVIELADRDVLVPAELLGEAGNDSLTGGNNDDTLIGGTGNDFLMGSAGADIHDGGEGIDTASYWNSPVGVFHDLNTGDATGDAIGDVIFDSIEGIEGSPFDDEFIDTELDRFLLGRAGNDTLIGNDGNDSLNGGEDDDLLNGGNGDDTLLGEAGDDTLDGELGLDLLNGGGGNDLLNGQEDNDTLLGEAGDDTLYGELGLDSLSGGDDNDLLNGQEDNDTLLGEAGDDTLYGELGLDSLSGGLGNDFLDGGTENDTLLGGDLNDTLFGGDDQDYLDGEKGHDYLDGGADQDTLIGGYGRDTLMGGLDDDLLEGGGARDFLDGGEGNDTLYGGDSTDLLMGRAGDDILYGGEWNDFVSGGNDNDLIFGEQSNDVLYGDDGEDTLDGGEGQDLLRGGTGQDTLLGGSGDDTLYGDDGEDTIDGEAGNDSLIGGNNDDTLRGGTGDDFLMGGAGADIYDGGEGIDTASYWNSPVGVFHDLNTGDATGDAIGDVIFDSIEGIEGSPFDDEFIDTELDRFLLGRAGNDTLTGNDGDDSLDGGEDDDFLEGGKGEDTLTGGQGNDQFVYQQLEDGQDLIQDFTVDQDKIVLTELFNNLGINVVDYDDAIAQGYIEFSLSAQGVDLIFDPANNLLPDTVLATVENISINELNKANNFVI